VAAGILVAAALTAVGLGLGVEAFATPSLSARMVCAHEAREDLATALGVSTTSIHEPTWTNGVYACQYEYPDGTMTLSVTELADSARTTAYYDGLRRQLGHADTVDDLGDGAFVTTNGSLVVRKDDKVLVVDTTSLPAQFGSPAKSRAQIAITVGTTILGCWTGE
jgi:hypothetical protein